MNVIFHANGGIFNANGGASETVTAKAVANRTPEYSALIAPPKPLPTKDGYVLTGWYTDSVGGTSFMFDQKWTVGMIEEQQDRTITLYARWEKAPEEPEETDSFPALAAGALLLAGDDNPFRDVRAIDWFYDDVMYAYDRGLITGTAYGKFSPRDSFTRGMLLTILARHDGVNTKGTPWYQAGCDWAAKNGISDGENPEEAISREEFALILYRYAQYLGKQAIERADLSRYTDAGAVSETALPAVQWAAAEAILRGDNFRLNPQDGATRAEAAAMLHRFFTR
ncbi:MAG: S-layer homology domain-containing protein [Firmicutes bacterium]|nr:S-layer homology domain-containing protein [Bacillota bacterium]